MPLGRYGSWDRPEQIRIEQRSALVVQRQAIGLYVVKPHVLRAAGAGFGETQNRRRHTGVRLERPGWQLDHGLQIMLLHQLLPQTLVRSGRAEQHTFRDDDGSAATDTEQVQESRDEKQLRLLRRRADDLLQAGIQILCRFAGERRVRQHQRVSPRFVLVRQWQQRIAVRDVRLLDAVHEHVHCRDAHHGRVEVVAMEHVGFVMIAVRLCHEGLAPALPGVLRPLGGTDKETGGATCRVDDAVVERRIHQCHHQVDDVTGRAELAVGTRSGQLRQHVLVQITGQILVLQIQLVDLLHRQP